MKLLVDADIVAFIASLKPTIFEVTDNMEGALSFFRTKTECNDVVMVFSDATNFRKTMVDPNYKSDRGPKPELYSASLAYAYANYETISTPGLEADDTLGIMATTAPGEYIIVSSDKDLRQIPGQLFNPKHPEFGVETIDKTAADYWFYSQVITGDPVDGYSGIPGKGPAAVPKIIGKPGDLSEAQMWAAIEDAYVKHYTIKGFPPDNSAEFAKAYALSQARLARILRVEDYDVMDGVKLWTPCIP